MTLDLDEAERLCAAATQGPWSCVRGSVFDSRDEIVTTARPGGPVPREANAAFIAHARTFVPAAVARVRELEAALAAERDAHARARNRLICGTCGGAGPHPSGITCICGGTGRMEDESRNARLAAIEAITERDAAIARAETAERERDDLRTQAEASLVVPCACGRPMPSVSSRLRCDACRAEGERDEARAQTAAFRAVLSDIAEDYGVPYDDQQCDAPKRATEALEASDAGAPLLAELRALRAVRDAAAEHVRWDWLHLLVDDPNADDVRSDVERLRAAIDATKGGG